MAAHHTGIILDHDIRNGKQLLLQRLADIRDGEHRDLRLDVGLRMTNENALLYRGALVLMVGATGSGKSSVATHIALSAAVRRGHKVVYVSTEDGRDLFNARQANWFLGIDPKEMMFGDVSDRRRLELGSDAIPNFDLTLYTDKRQLDDVIGTIDHHARDGADLIVLDYVQAIRPPMSSNGMAQVEPDRRSLISSATAAVRQIVERYKVTVLLMSQSRRMKPNEELELSCAKEAGELENSCDIGILLEATKDDELRHEATLLTVAKHKFPMVSRPWRFQRDANWGGAFVEVDRAGARAEPMHARIWERDDDQNNPQRRPEVQQRRHESGGGGELEQPDVEPAPANGAGKYSPGWANRHDVR